MRTSEGKELSSDRSQLKLSVKYGKGKEHRKEKTMIARFDHRPMLTAALALSTTVLVVVVITMSTLLITSAPPAATSSSVSDSGNAGAGAAPKVMDAGGENYGWNVQPKAAEPAQSGDSALERHQKLVNDYAR